MYAQHASAPTTSVEPAPLSPRGARLQDAAALRGFILAGDAVFALLNPETGTRFTYAVRTPQGEARPHFVSVLTGPDNRHDYTFVGTIFDGLAFRHGRRSPIDINAPSVRAFAWAWRRIALLLPIAPAELWHEGRCGKCGRTLTDPASIAAGLGPTCRGRM